MLVKVVSMFHSKISSRKSRVIEKAQSLNQRMSRSDIIKTIAHNVGLKQAQVSSVFEELAMLVKNHLDMNGSGEFLVPKLGIKIKRVKRKATKTRSTVSPLIQSRVLIPSKPERWDVKVQALKTLKDIISQEKLS